MAAADRLSQLQAKWDPTRARNVDQEFEEVNLEEGDVCFKLNPKILSLSSGFRAFTNKKWEQHYRTPQEALEPIQDEARTVWCGGFSHNPQKLEARAGGAIWYGRNSDCNRPVLLRKSERQVAATATVAAVLGAINECPENIRLRCIVLNDQVFEAITKKLAGWNDLGFTGIKDATLYRALLSKLRHRKAPTLFGKATPQDKSIRKEVNTLAKIASTIVGPVNGSDIAAISESISKGVKVTEMTQAIAYQTIKEMTIPKPRPRTEDIMGKIQKDIQAATGTAPVPEIIWRGIRNPLIPRRARNFMYMAVHGALRIGNFWKHIPNCEERVNCDFCGIEENLEHILFKCQRPWRKMVWDIVEELWLKSNPDALWLEPALGTTLGCCSFPAPSKTQRKENLVQDRLYRILMIEAGHFIWKLRCEIVIERKNEDITIPEAHGRWTHTLNRRLEKDQKLTAKRWKNNRIPRTVVLDTWNTIIKRTTDLPDDWVGETGVLVGVRPYTDFG
ncbi:hypothetical protein EV361DRAFT_811258 [Lentinula raphanica]|nr:hypothetical protein EV361DRAFT_811258 [Lentinula raphanica]